VLKTLREFELAQMKQGVPAFRPGDTVRVSLKIVEGDKERVQEYEGLCIRRRGGGLRETFTVRRVSYGIGMERTFPLHSPQIDKIQITRRGKVRRSRLYYLRQLRGKKARVAEDRSGARVSRIPAVPSPEPGAPAASAEQ
jgi:large subunit ribosomal protein L19